MADTAPDTAPRPDRPTAEAAPPPDPGTPVGSGTEVEIVPRRDLLGATTVEATPPPRPAPTGSAPPAVPGYAVRAELARGGMGVVYTARDLSLDREVAIKTLLPDYADSPPVAARFARESRITARLPHPGVPPVHAQGRLPDGRPFLAMKLITGKTLSAILPNTAASSARKGRQPSAGNEPAVDSPTVPAPAAPNLLAVFEAICQTVGFAHSVGVIHRDLKPANVMVGSFGEVQVMDWGLAKEMRNEECGIRNTASGTDASSSIPHSGYHTPHSDDESEETVLGKAMGTPAYMPPEQAKGEWDKVDARADVFALGGLLCAVLTGQPAYVSKPGTDLMTRAKAGDLADAFARLDGCGAEPELVALAKRCLAPDPTDRPADAGAVAKAVADHRSGVEERLRAAELDRVRAEAETREQRKRRKVQLALAASVLLLAGLVGFGTWWRDKIATQKRIDDLERDRIAVAKRASEDQARRSVEEQIRIAGDQRQQLRFGDAAKSLNTANLMISADAGTQQYEARIQSARADLQFAELLDRIRYEKWVWVALPGGKGRYNEAAVPEKYRAAFLENGFDVATASPADLATRIRGSAIRDELVVALDDWAILEPDPAIVAKLLDVAAAVAPDEWADRLRSPAIRADPAQLQRLAAEAMNLPLRPAAISMLTDLMRRKGLDPVPLLVRAHLARRDDFAIAFAVSRDLSPDKPQQAIGYCLAALAVRPDHGPALNNLAVLYYRTGDRPSAVEVFTRFFQDPKNAADAIAHGSFGWVLQEDKQFDPAAGEYMKAVEADPAFVEAYVNLSSVLSDLRRYDEALGWCERGLRLDPRSAILHGNYGSALAATGDFGPAVEHLEEAIKLGNDSADVYVNLGKAQFRREEWKSAVVAFQKAIDRDPKLADAHLGAGLTLYETGRFVDALPHLKRAAELGNAEAPAAAARCGRMIQRAARLAQVRAGDGPEPTAGDLLNCALVCFTFERRYAEAVAFFRKAFAADPALAGRTPGARSDAAESALLAAAGHGESPPAEAARPELRGQAQKWLAVELDALTAAADRSPAEAHEELTRWLTRPGFATVRHPFLRAAVPPAEAQAWTEFWDRVRDLWARTGPR